MDENDRPKYEARRYGTTWAVFRDGGEFPVIPVYDEEAAVDLATTLNWAAADRERHREMPGATRTCNCPSGSTQES